MRRDSGEWTMDPEEGQYSSQWYRTGPETRDNIGNKKIYTKRTTKSKLVKTVFPISQSFRNLIISMTTNLYDKVCFKKNFSTALPVFTVKKK